jgi:prephenate dehydrogenase/prephenate dehydratase
MQRQQIGIIGYGRFGQFWARTLAEHHDVWVTDHAHINALHFLPLSELCARSDTLFLCVPINQIETVVRAIQPHLRAGMTVFDTCSVKSYPAGVLTTNLAGNDLTLIASHPMFGPDSASRGMAGFPIVLWPLAGDQEVYRTWMDFFAELGLIPVEIPPDEHDRLAAYSQGITHYMGRVLGELKLPHTLIDTQGFKTLLALIEQTCNDSLELFHDLQHYNPHTQAMRLALETALNRVYDTLLPDRVSPDEYVIGIQGGKGSFNEEACRHYCMEHTVEIPRYRLVYLYTAENVLGALHRGEVDFGVFAIQNARGGAVMETIQALSRFSCEILETFQIVISHCLLLHPEAVFEEVDTVISHPQALAQCAGTLMEKYPHLRQTSGEGDLIDQAHCAQYLALGKLPRSTTVLAPRVCADLYGLVIQDEGLQDLGMTNLTTFAWTRRRFQDRQGIPIS